MIEAIAESAFKTSPYPVILSFENHVDSWVIILGSDKENGSLKEKLKNQSLSYSIIIFLFFSLSRPPPLVPSLSQGEAAGQDGGIL